MCLFGGETASKSHGQVRRQSWSLTSVQTLMHAENMARGGQIEFPKCREDEGIYDVLTFQKSRGG